MVAASLASASICPVTDAKAELLSLHEQARQAHLQGKAELLADSLADVLLLAEKGVIETRSKAEVTRFYQGYLQRVRYSEWRDAGPPVVTVSPDGTMAWMAIAVEANYTRADKPAEGVKSFKSSWIATYTRDKCRWRMTGIASSVAE
jgi:hypothetical protein